MVSTGNYRRGRVTPQAPQVCPGQIQGVGEPEPGREDRDMKRKQYTQYMGRNTTRYKNINMHLMYTL